MGCISNHQLNPNEPKRITSRFFFSEMYLVKHIFDFLSTDMKIYGYCPALDSFYLVVCSHCGQLVKPQAFEAHCERRHGALIKMCNPSSCLADKQCPRPGRQSVIPSSREKHKKVETQEAGGFSKPATAPQHRTTKVLTEEARYYTGLCWTAIMLEHHFV